MKKNTNIFVILMAIIGVICTAAVVCVIFKDRVKGFLNQDEDLDFDFEEEFMDDDDEIDEEDSVEEAEEEAEDEEEETPVPKARRGYIRLKFPQNEAM